jgi:hypothetical protein
MARSFGQGEQFFRQLSRSRRRIPMGRPFRSYGNFLPNVASPKPEVSGWPHRVFGRVTDGKASSETCTTPHASFRLPNGFVATAATLVAAGPQVSAAVAEAAAKPLNLIAAGAIGRGRNVNRPGHLYTVVLCGDDDAQPNPTPTRFSGLRG